MQNHCLGLWNKLVTILQQNKNNDHDNYFTLYNNTLVCELSHTRVSLLPSGVEWRVNVVLVRY